jgi:hypothetical protein
MMRKFLLLSVLLLLVLAACTGGQEATTAPLPTATAETETMANAESTAVSDESMDDETMADDSMSDDSMADEAMADEAMSDETMDGKEDEAMSDESMDDEAMADEDESMDDESMSDEAMADESMDDEAMAAKEEPINFELVQGWYEGDQTFYYDFGAHTQASEDGSEVITAPIYVLVTGFDEDGNPQVVEGQHNIVDVVPGDEGYSDLWEVTFVTVPEDYEANTITSAQEILDGNYEMTVPGVYVNCPIVPAGSELENAEDAPLVTGWYRGEQIFYFDFGPNEPITAPIYAFVTGFDTDGNPQFVDGQHNVIGVVPGDEGYSAFWYVNLVVVPEEYQADTITSVQEVLDSDYEMVQPGLLVNCPVVTTDN